MHNQRKILRLNIRFGKVLSLDSMLTAIIMGCYFLQL